MPRPVAPRDTLTQNSRVSRRLLPLPDETKPAFRGVAPRDTSPWHALLIPTVSRRATPQTKNEASVSSCRAARHLEPESRPLTPRDPRFDETKPAFRHVAPRDTSPWHALLIPTVSRRATPQTKNEASVSSCRAARHLISRWAPLRGTMTRDQGPRTVDLTPINRNTSMKFPHSILGHRPGIRDAILGPFPDPTKPGPRRRVAPRDTTYPANEARFSLGRSSRPNQTDCISNQYERRLFAAYGASRWHPLRNVSSITKAQATTLTPIGQHCPGNFCARAPDSSHAERSTRIGR